jgi:hypothetical protein
MQKTRNDISDIKFQFEKIASNNESVSEENDDLDIIIEIN